jgi:hypothetical protein
MDSLCKRVQELLLDKNNLEFKNNQELADHLTSCEECIAFGASLQEVDSSLTELPEYDVSDEVVASTLEAVGSEPLCSEASGWQDLVKAWASSLGARIQGKLPNRRRAFAFAFLGFLAFLVFTSFPSSDYPNPSGAYSDAAYSDSALRHAIGTIFSLIEGAFGVLLMVLCFFLALGFWLYAFTGFFGHQKRVLRRRFVPAVTFSTAFICIFVARSMVSLFFGADFEDRDAGVYTQAGGSVGFANGYPLLEQSSEVTYGEAGSRKSPRRSSQYAKNEELLAVDEVADLDSIVESEETEGAEDWDNGRAFAKLEPESPSPKEIYEQSQKLRAEYRRRLVEAPNFPRSRDDAMESSEGWQYGHDGPTELYMQGDYRDAAGELKREKRLEVQGGEASKQDLDATELSDEKGLGNAGYYSDNEPFDSLGGRLSDGESQSEAKKRGFKANESALLAMRKDSVDFESLPHVPPAPSSIVAPTAPAEMDDSVVSAGKLKPAPDSIVLSKARAFLAKINSISGLRIQEAKGYWKNTYIPGDQQLRILRQSVSGFDKSRLGLGDNSTIGLERDSVLPHRPFDVPQNSALAVYLHSNRKGIEAKSRMLVQVGLQATERFSGLRPAMNIGVVFDLRGRIDPQTAKSFRSLAMAFVKARDIGDRFSITVAGKPGALIVPPDEFRHGTVVLAAKKLFETKQVTGQGLSLTEAIDKSLESVRASDDPTAPLGSSLVILVTPHQLGQSETRAIAEVAHNSSVSGIPFSAIGVGSSFSKRELDRIVLHGQGNRRFLGDATDAEKLVEREIYATSRVVARAVRLNIKLAPGVQLVDVLGSERLDQKRTAYVKQAEKAIDQRISKNLGIEADRGEDEEGIQIIIPAFYAAGSHVILLDVVVEKPGHVADVTARFKDLANLRNGVSRASLAVGSYPTALSPLEINVLKNRIVHESVLKLQDAASYVGAGRARDGANLLSEHSDMIRELVELMPEFSGAVDLEQDQKMLREYAEILNSRKVRRQGNKEFLKNSLSYAALLKYLPRPDVNSGFDSRLAK